MRLRLTILVACVATATVWFPTTVGATPAPTCGMTVTTSITLRQDLICPGVAMFVESNGGPTALTIDLGGHTISSLETRDYRLTMTLQNGRVTGGIEDESANDVYTRLTFDGGDIISVNDADPRILYCHFIHGAFVDAGENSIDIEHNTFSGDGSALAAIGLSLTYGTVVGNVITGYAAGVGVTDELSSADVRDNVITHNGVGITIVGPANIPATVKGNTVIGNRGDGIHIGDGTNSQITGNTTLFNGGDGIHIDPSPVVSDLTFGLIAQLGHNVSMANRGWGIEAPPAGPNVAVVDGGGNIAHFNRAGQCQIVACR